MCGIAGIIGPKDKVHVNAIEALENSLVHRGPDDEGVEIIRPSQDEGHLLVLINRRLAILDLSQLGHQPMRDAETGNWIIYNGEIYNFKEIRQDLEMRGVTFQSRCDTEVILKAYACYGIEVLNKLRGMFAFAIWDEGKQKLILARDRLGIKPLYYYTGENNFFMFASELRSLLSTGIVPKRIDPNGMESYLAYGAVQEPLTIVRDVHSLLPAHYLEVLSNGSISRQQCYWHIPFSPVGAPRPDEKEILSQLRHLLEEVVSQHLISDVPIGVFLSGGIDSSSIAALAGCVAPDRLHTFSVTFAEDEYSEANYSRRIADKYSSQHTEIKLSEKQLLLLLPDLMKALDQPTIDGINTYVISKVVRNAGVFVALSGQGGDEIFGGYNTFQKIRQFTKYCSYKKVLPQSIRTYAAKLWVALKGSVGNKISELLQTNGDVLSAYFILRQLFLPPTRKMLFPNGGSDELLNGYPVELALKLKHDIDRLDPTNQVSLLELQTYLANMLLRDGDFMSMAHGLELRVPFLDHNLVEFLAQIPGDLKTQHSLPKPLLVRVMEKELPSEIYLRPKMGFTFPWEHWLRNELRAPLQEVLSDQESIKKIGLDPKACNLIWTGFLNGEPGITWSRVWGLYVVTKWSNQMELTL